MCVKILALAVPKVKTSILCIQLNRLLISYICEPGYKMRLAQGVILFVHFTDLQGSTNLSYAKYFCIMYDRIYNTFNMGRKTVVFHDINNRAQNY